MKTSTGCSREYLAATAPLLAILLGFAAAASAQTPPVPVPVSMDSLQTAQLHSADAASGSTSEGLSAGASTAFSGLGPSSQVQIFLPGYNYAPAPRENIIFTKPEPDSKPAVPAMEAMGDAVMEKVHYSKQVGGFTLGKTAGYILTSLTAAVAGAGIGWYVVGGVAATVGLGLLGLAAGIGLAVLFIGVLGGTFGAAPRKDGFDAKVSF